MGRPQHKRLTLMPEECKGYMREQKRRSVWQAAEELERQAKKTKRLAGDATKVDENEDGEVNEEEEEDFSEDEACAGIPREDDGGDEEEGRREGKFEEALFRKTYPNGYPYYGLSFAFQWTNEPRHLNPGSVREYDRRAYARVSPTTQPRGKDDGQTKISPPEYPKDLPILGSWCCGKVNCTIHENSSRKFQESNKFWPIQGRIIRMLHRSRLPADD
ncbi:uncharacterized protein EAE98_005938 [Botrytis deweyae]|uniref:Uncharacterized protein n=1 Tax=Botrytis deweyae TaxID=2478750 RepID=A0ABQ7IL75_9HELO|nr:uncharacterized protein EAE98_005938 [Botrytis deweyae]KAF7927556.1 hypothetical protein EAE98_005938 [Botrytis deweyae]